MFEAGGAGRAGAAEQAALGAPAMGRGGRDVEAAPDGQRQKGHVPGSAGVSIGTCRHARLQQSPDMSILRPGSRSNPCPFRLVLLRFSLEMGVHAAVHPVPAS